MADISRRSMFGTLAAIAVAPSAALATKSAGKFGMLTVEEASYRGIRERTRVLVNDIDVTDLYTIIAADDVEGYILCYARDKSGGLRPDGRGNLTMMRIDGKVEIRVLDEVQANG